MNLICLPYFINNFSHLKNVTPLSSTNNLVFEYAPSSEEIAIFKGFMVNYERRMNGRSITNWFLLWIVVVVVIGERRAQHNLQQQRRRRPKQPNCSHFENGTINAQQEGHPLQKKLSQVELFCCTTILWHNIYGRITTNCTCTVIYSRLSKN